MALIIFILICVCLVITDEIALGNLTKENFKAWFDELTAE